jgi:altronate dehydratase small subunit
MPIQKAIIINVKDNVANALIDLKEDDFVKVKVGKKLLGFTIKNNIPFGHKFAIKIISKGEKVIKYGEIIGEATQNIDAGEHVHTHNVIGLRARGDLEKIKA